MQGFSLSGQGSLQAAGVVLCQSLMHDFRRQLSTKGCRVGGQGPGAAALSEGVQVSAGVVYVRRNLAIGLQPTGKSLMKAWLGWLRCAFMPHQSTCVIAS